jgi:two-component system cell cycle sensor histidine kinase/response regulator CckA
MAEVPFFNSPMQAVAQARREAILLIEDSPLDARLILDTLRGQLAGTPITHCSSLSEATEFTNPGVVLLDLNLPDEYGLATLDRTRALFPDAAIVVISGLSEPELMGGALREGAQDFVSKNELSRTDWKRVLRYASERQRGESERRRILAEKQTIESRYESLFQKGQIGIYRAVLGGELLDCNEGALRILGYERREDIAGIPRSEFFWDPADLHQSSERLLADGSLQGLEMRLRHRDGRLVWVLANAVLIPQPDGLPIVEGVFTDITQRKLAQEELRISRERMRQVLSQMPGFIWMTDRELRILTSEGRSLEYMPSFGLGQTLYEYYGTSDPDYRAIRYHRQALSGQSVAYETTWGGRSLQCFIEPLRNSEGTIDGCLGVCLDVTDRVIAEGALRAREQLYGDLFENASDCVFTLDGAGRFLSVNPAVVALTGYRAEELLGMQFRELARTAPADGDTDPIAAVLQSGKDSCFGIGLRTRTGKPLTLEVNARPVIRDGAAVGVQAIGRDIGERVRVEAEMREAQKLQTIGRLAAGIAHEFNNLLTIMLGNLELSVELGGLSPEQDELLLQVRRAAERAASTTSQLLAYGRRQIVSPTRLHLSRLVRDAAKLLAPVLGKRIELRLETGDDHLFIEADSVQLTQVLVNLALNARDAMPNGGILEFRTRKSRLEESADGGGREPYAMIEVRDSGHGMDSATQARIFDPFFTTKPVGEGAGLGLSMVYGIVRQAGGFIQVESAPGEGSTFKLYFPQASGTQPTKESRPDGG